MDGFEEEARSFVGAAANFMGANGFRAMGGCGPHYEVIAERDDMVRIRFVDGDEEFDYPRADAEADPIA